MEYDIDFSLSQSDHKFLASLHDGQYSLVYAVVSRTTRNRMAKISQEELDAVVETLEASLDEDNLSTAEQNTCHGLLDFLYHIPL